jgi:AbrB family looped-hinge helix DNA binding protein
VTIPKKLRDRFGIKSKSPVVLELREDGIMIKPAITVTIREFPNDFVKEITEADQLKSAERKGAKNIFKNGYILPYSEVYLSYGPKRQVRVEVGKDTPAEILLYFKRFFDTIGVLKEEHILNFTEFLNGLPGNGNHEVRCYDDVMEYIADHQDAEHRRSVVRSHFKKGIDSPIFRRILKTEYIEGILGKKIEVIAIGNSQSKTV